MIMVSSPEYDALRRVYFSADACNQTSTDGGKNVLVPKNIFFDMKLELDRAAVVYCYADIPWVVQKLRNKDSISDSKMPHDGLSVF